MHIFPMAVTIKNYLENVFRDSPSKLKVVNKMMLYGISVKNDRLYCNDVEIPYKSLGDACGVDQRVIKSTVIMILNDEFLSKIFSKLGATVNLKDVSKDIGFGVLVISATDSKEPGIIASVSSVIADFNINIIQAIIEDPEFIEEPKLYIITEKPLPGEAIPKIKNLKNIKSITII
jgi:predicted regulator of amino acid metabolism with ACT domain